MRRNPGDVVGCTCRDHRALIIEVLYGKRWSGSGSSSIQKKKKKKKKEVKDTELYRLPSRSIYLSSKRLELQAAVGGGGGNRRLMHSKQPSSSSI